MSTIIEMPNCRPLRGLARLIDPKHPRPNLRGVHVSMLPGVGVFGMATDTVRLGVYRLGDLPAQKVAA